MATLEDVVSELHKQTESGKIQWRHAGPRGFIAEMDTCSFLITRDSTINGDMALHVRVPNNLSSKNLGASHTVDHLFQLVMDKLGVGYPLTDHEALQMALDSLERNDSQSSEMAPRRKRVVFR